MIVDAHLAALLGNLSAAPVLLLGRDALTVRPLETIFGLIQMDFASLPSIACPQAGLATRPLSTVPHGHQERLWRTF